MTVYLTAAEVLAIHADRIERYGGGPGLRDRGLLEAAVFRPHSGYYPDLIAEAAALRESLGQNHPFVDGDKRVAFAATYTFLKARRHDHRRRGRRLRLHQRPLRNRQLHVRSARRLAEGEHRLRSTVPLIARFRPPRLGAPAAPATP